METRPFAARHSPFALLRLHRTLHTRVDRVERGRAADIEPVALLAAEAEIGDRFRNVDLADQLARRRVAANAVLTRIAPADGAPDAPVAIGTHPVGDARLWHLGKHLAIRQLSSPEIDVERADVRRIIGPIREAGVEHIEPLLVRREGETVRLDEIVDDDLDLSRFG